MNRPNAIFLIAALICAPLAVAITISEASDEFSALMKMITDNEDARMNAEDLAFFLATHDFDATPEDGDVIVKLEGMIYGLTPNGEKPGLSDVTIISNTLN